MSGTEGTDKFAFPARRVNGIGLGNDLSPATCMIAFYTPNLSFFSTKKSSITDNVLDKIKIPQAGVEMEH